MSVFGYARTSTLHQNIEGQVNQLKQAGAEHIFEDQKSGKDLDREGLENLLSKLNKGDTLMVTKMDRIARNVKEGIGLIDELTNMGIKLHVLNMGLFDGSPTSKLITNILLSVADWEREMMLERQRSGIEDAKKAGKYKGRPQKYTARNKGMQHALELFHNRNTNGMTVNEIADITKISRATLYRASKRKK
ncbi:recombinase family protein [Bacillus sp. CGMCC 1.16607]|uniref:recombinase family protein n=1 Tax=Bacillus sp. CGMCC 1.16607 TaxID=3351842 RepID=UPI0036434EFA